jgi:Fe2+ transport system protein FeoA
MVAHTIPLEMLQTGQSGQIADVSGESGLVRRLAEMGLRPGVSVRMVQPGRPCIVAVEQQRYSLRGESEALVLVEVDS